MGLALVHFQKYWLLRAYCPNIYTVLKGQTLSPGFIDPHLHPSMAAFILTMNFITPFDWNFPWSRSTTKGVRSEKEYR